MLNNRDSLSDEKYLRQAIELSHEALNLGNAPFGAVIVKNGKVLSSAANRTLTDGNLTFHAEMICIHRTSLNYGINALEGATMYSSCEPCIMCLFGAYYAKVSKIVFAAQLKDAIKFGSGDPPVYPGWIAKKGKLNIELVQGPLREDALRVFLEFQKKHEQRQSKQNKSLPKN